MGLDSHLNWDTYRREIAGIADQYPDAAVAIVQRSFMRFYEELQECNIEDVQARVEYDIQTADIRDYEWKYLDDEEAELVKQIQQNPSKEVRIIQDLEDEGFDTSWVYYSDIEAARRIRQTGFESRLDSFNESHRSRQEFDLRTIGFHSPAIALIWMEEITGQISDGAWENARQTQNGQWKQWCYAKVTVDTTVEETRLYGPELPGMGFNPGGKLGEYEGMFGRMIFYVRASGVDPDYSLDDLKSDLKNINRAL